MYNMLNIQMLLRLIHTHGKHAIISSRMIKCFNGFCLGVETAKNCLMVIFDTQLYYETRTGAIFYGR